MKIFSITGRLILEVASANLCGANLRWANLSEADLSGANLRWANLSEADLRGANLCVADLRWADLSGASLSEADLSGANLCGASLSGADLRGANLCVADLRWANLHGANLSGANLSEAKNIPSIPHTVITPEGDLIVYKKVSNGIAKLLIPKEAKRSNATGRKCRAEFAIVLDCPDGAVSLHDSEFYYHKNTTIRPIGAPFDDNRWNECAPGIHFYLTREEAENY